MVAGVSIAPAEENDRKIYGKTKKLSQAGKKAGGGPFGGGTGGQEGLSPPASQKKNGPVPLDTERVGVFRPAPGDTPPAAFRRTAAGNPARRLDGWGKGFILYRSADRRYVSLRPALIGPIGPEGEG